MRARVAAALLLCGLTMLASRALAQDPPTAPPTAPLAPRVPIRLVPYQSDDVYQVTLGPVTCTTPCTVGAPPVPSIVPLHAEGAGQVDAMLTFSGRPGTIRIRHLDRTKLIAGAILLPAGVLIGATMWSLALRCDDVTCGRFHGLFWPTLGAATAATGIALLRLSRVPDDANRLILDSSDPGGDPTQPEGETKVHSPALAGGGIALTVFGALSIAAGIATIVVDQNTNSDLKGLASVGVGAPLLINGAGCIGGGVPMIVIGRRRIPVVPVLSPVVAPPTARGGGKSLGLVWQGEL